MVPDSSIKFLPSRDAFDEFGWLLVPAQNWSPVMKRPGVARLDQQGMRSDDYEGYVRVKVEPIMDGGTKVAIGVNDHFALSVDNEPSSTEGIASLLGDEWASISNRAKEILGHIRKLAS